MHRALLALCLGGWVLHSTASPGTKLDGEWLCHEQVTGSTGAAAVQPHYVSIDHGIWQTDTVDADLQLQALDGQHYLGTWSPDTQRQPREIAHLAADQLHYQDPRATGTCQRLGDIAQAPAPQRSGSWQFITLDQARPTQPAVGYDQIYSKQARYRDLRWKQAFDDWCRLSGLGGVRKKSVTPASRLTDVESFACQTPAAERNLSALKTVVLGPGGQIYMTDGHHSLSSLWEAPIGQGDDRLGKAGGGLRIPVQIQADYQHLNQASFWRTMRAKGYTWLQDADGKAIAPASLPRHMGLSGGLQDDAYRSLVYFTRGVGHEVPDDAPEFLEFYWAQWLRSPPQHLDLRAYQLDTLGRGDGSDHGYLQAVHDAATLMTQAPPDTAIGPTGQTAADMGQMPALHHTTLQQLARKGQTPGKLAQALHYRSKAATASKPESP